MLLAFLLVFSYHSNSQENYQFEVVPIAAEKVGINGQLSQGRVSDIVEDERGLIWIGTLDGLNRYDGYKVKVFRHNTGDSTTLDNNQIVKILKTRKSFLWVLTKTGINKFDSYLETSSLLKFPEHFNKVYKIHDIILDKSENLWIARSDGLYVLRNDSQVIIKIEIDAYFQDAQELEVDHLNNIWIGSSEPYLIKYNHHLKEVTSYKYPVFYDDSNKYFVYDIHQDNENNIWVATFTNSVVGKEIPNVFVMEKGKDSFRIFDEFLPELIENNHYTFLSTVRKFGSRDNELWISGMSNGVAKIDHLNKKFTYFPDYREFKWHREIDKNVIYFDSNDELWLGTNGDGVFILPEKNELFKIVNKELFEDFALMSVRSFLDFKENILIGGYSGLISMNKKTKVFEKTSTDRVVYCMEIYPGDSNYVLIGSEGSGLLKFNPQNNSFEPFHEMYKELKGYENPWMWIFDIYNDGDSVYWCGARDGVIKYNVSEKGFELYGDNSNNGFKYGNILNIYRDYSGQLFAGGDESGLLIFDNEKKIFKKYECRQSPDFDFQSFRINHINQTPDSIYWLSTDKGLIMISKHNIQIVTKQDGLLNDYVYASIPDEEGNLWLSTNDGVFKYNYQDRNITSFSVYDGLQAQEFNTGAYYKTNDGTIYLGGVEGFNYFNPQKIYHSKQELPMVIIGFYLNNEEINLSKEIASKKIYNIPARVEYFKFEFAALYYHANSKFRYKYRINELHKNWIDLGYENEIGFHGLDPGNYTLEILAADHHGNWNAIPLSIKLNVKSHIWETKLFRYGGVVLIILMVLGILNYRYVLLKRQKLEIEKTVQERTKELSIVNAEIRKANETKDKFFAIISHDIKNPLAAAQSVSSDLIEDYDQYTKEEREELLGILNRSMIYLQTLLENLRSWSRLQNKEIVPEFNICDLNEIVNNNARLVAASLLKKKIELNVYMDKELYIKADCKMIDTILRNLISNAIKFSYSHSTINISSQRKNKFIELQVEDNGIGMNEKQVDNLFIPGLSQSLPGTEDEKGTGFGLLMVYEFVKLNNGKINVVSEPDHGARFILTFPAGTKKAVS